MTEVAQQNDVWWLPQEDGLMLASAIFFKTKKKYYITILFNLP